MGTVRRSLPVQDQHQLFRGVFEDWRTKAGALSALPDAPVVPDDSRRERAAWRRRLLSRLGPHEEGPSGVGPAAPPLPS